MAASKIKNGAAREMKMANGMARKSAWRKRQYGSVSAA
jgi:hypothetical protein